MSVSLGIDTSNYTTSVAAYRPDGTGQNVGKLLTVPEGGMGLRQSDALFQHVKRLPDRIQALREAGWLEEPITAVGASTRPRSVEGSYMPCFLAGESQGRSLAAALDVPFYGFSHQEGHLAAACWSAGRMELLEQPFLAWHLSGGTTELLLVEPKGRSVSASCIGGTTDLSAGQLIDRTGRLLGIPFPAGKGMDALSQASSDREWFPVKVDAALRFSFSGMENKAKELIQRHREPCDIAHFILLTIAETVRRVTDQAMSRYPGLPVFCSGGVASNSLLRTAMPDAVFAEPQYSTDNAMGIAILTHRQLNGG